MATVGKASHRWQAIGLNVGFLKSELDEIQNKPLLVAEGSNGFFRELLGRWLNWAPPDHKFPTGSDLASALRMSNVGEERLAHGLKRKLEQGKGYYYTSSYHVHCNKLNYYILLGRVTALPSVKYGGRVEMHK